MAKALPALSAPAPSKPKRRKSTDIKKRNRGAPKPHKFSGKCIKRTVRGVEREICFNDKGYIRSNKALKKD